MTLISSIVSPSAGFVSASDIILSVRSQNAPIVDLPLRDTGFSFSKDGRALCGTAQKTVIFGRSLIQWTGPMSTCRKVIEALREKSGQGELYVTKEDCFTASTLESLALAEIGLIYHFVNQDDTVSSWAHNSYSEKHGDSILHYNGSGLAPYIFNTGLTPPPGISIPALVIGTAYSRAAAHYLKEAATNEAYEDWFGGWIEFAWKKEGRFEAVPSAIKLWIILENGQLIASEPYIFSSYIDNKLLIVRTKLVLEGEELVKSYKLLAVSSVLNGVDDRKPTRQDLSLNPHVTFHLVIDQQKRETRSLQTFAYDTQGFSAKLDDKKDLILAWSADFENLLRGNDRSVWLAELE